MAAAAAAPVQRSAAQRFAVASATATVQVVNLEDVVDETADLIYEEEISRNK